MSVSFLSISTHPSLLPIGSQNPKTTTTTRFQPRLDATEALLASDPDVAPWIQKYQQSRETVSRTNYEVDLMTTFTKLSTLGQKINYEASTYPRAKIDITKLKL